MLLLIFEYECTIVHNYVRLTSCVHIPYINDTEYPSDSLESHPSHNRTNRIKKTIVTLYYNINNYSHSVS